MKKLFILLLITLLTPIFAYATVLEASVSIDDVPKILFGQWRITSKLDNTNAPKSFRPQSIDFWNLSRINNTLKLDNPYSGANAEISVQTVEGNIVVFTKRLKYDNKILTDTVTLRLNKNKFSGINTLCLESFSLVDNHLMKTETATYHINGEKIAGDNVIEVPDEKLPLDDTSF
jgi:hypothetical protein